MNKVPKFEFYFMWLAAIVPAYFFFKYPFSLGGSIAACFFILALIALLFHLRELSFVLVMLTIVLSGILVMNFLSYLENANTTMLEYIVIFCFSALWIIGFFYWIFCWPCKLKESLNETEKKLSKKISIIILAPSVFIGLQFCIYSSLIVFDIARSDPVLYNSIPILRALYIGPAGIGFCFLISYLYLSKINDEDIHTLISEEKLHLIKYDARTFKKRYLLIFCAFVIIGSGIEGGRNMWPIWIETILLVGIMSLILWKIYKHVFRLESPDDNGNIEDKKQKYYA